MMMCSHVDPSEKRMDDNFAISGLAPTELKLIHSLTSSNKNLSSLLSSPLLSSVADGFSLVGFVLYHRYITKASSCYSTCSACGKHGVSSISSGRTIR